MSERLGSPVQLAHDRLGAEQVAAIEAERRESTLDAALELVEAGPRASVGKLLPGPASSTTRRSGLGQGGDAL